ncbi:hypothetical protein CN422_30245 [Bacillus cereus]|nr:hypothetical protein CN422_30245 [Bacillus cereus]
MKDIRKEEKAWKMEQTKVVDEWKKKVEELDVKDDIKDLFSHEKDAGRTKEKRNIRCFIR